MFLGLADVRSLGVTLTLAGFGMLTGSLILSARGGPKRRLSGLLVFELLSALGFCLMGSRPILCLVTAAAFLAHVTPAITLACDQLDNRPGCCLSLARCVS